jgi:hypothetical protein
MSKNPTQEIQWRPLVTTSETSDDNNQATPKIRADTTPHAAQAIVNKCHANRMVLRANVRLPKSSGTSAWYKGETKYRSPSSEWSAAITISRIPDSMSQTFIASSTNGNYIVFSGTFNDDSFSPFLRAL